MWRVAGRGLCLVLTVVAVGTVVTGGIATVAVLVENLAAKAVDEVDERKAYDDENDDVLDVHSEKMALE